MPEELSLVLKYDMCSQSELCICNTVILFSAFLSREKGKIRENAPEQRIKTL